MTARHKALRLVPVLFAAALALGACQQPGASPSAPADETMMEESMAEESMGEESMGEESMGEEEP